MVDLGTRNDMEGEKDRCLRCGREERLQGVAVTLGTKTFHLFYLCSECGSVGIERLCKMIHEYMEKRVI